MDPLTSFAIIVLAGLIHACFQLSVSVLTLLSGHVIGYHRSHRKLVRMTGGFIFGASLMSLLLISFVSYSLVSWFSNSPPALAWSLVCGLLIGIALAVWLFYFRRQSGTSLWIPREMARYLSSRIKATKSTAESFGLGLGSVVGEILFLIAPLAVAGLAIIHLPSDWQLLGVLVYAFVSILPLVVVWALIGGGHNVSKIQKWRESNKYFLQFFAGAGLIILSLFVFVTQVMESGATA